MNSKNNNAWDKIGSRLSSYALHPRLFISQHVLPLFFRNTNSARATKSSGPIVSEEQFWGSGDDILYDAVELKNFRITDWFPRTPGVYWSHQARIARQMVFQNEPERDAELGLIYTPQSKMGLIESGGLGTIRLRPRRIDGEDCWFGTALTNQHCHTGIPLAIPIALMQSSGVGWGDTITLQGRVRFLQDAGLHDIGESIKGARPLIVFVDKLRGTAQQKSHEAIVITPVVMFASDSKYRDPQYSFVQCVAGHDSELDIATEWIEKYSTKHDGRIITNFDEQRPILANVPLSYQRLVSKTYDRTIAKQFGGATLVRHIETLTQQQIFNFGVMKMGHNINVTGDNAFISIDSSLNHISQTISKAPGLDDTQKSKLEAMIQSLTKELDNIKSSHPEEVEEITKAVKKAVAEASKPHKDRKKSMLQLSAKGLKDAAKLVKAVAPSVLATATLIAKFIVGLR